MNKTKPLQNPDAVYDPIRLHVDNDGDFTKDRPDVDLSRDDLWHVDALHHYFTFDDRESEEYGIVDGDAETPGQQLAKIITRTYHPEIVTGYTCDPVKQYVEPNWASFRDRTAFISGDVIPSFDTEPKAAIDSVIAWTKYYHGPKMIVLDAKEYYKEYATGPLAIDGVHLDKGDFSDLMHVANNMKGIIDEGIVNLYPNDARQVMRFINAEPGEHVFDDDDGCSTKWLTEGRFLAKRLVEFPVFRNNYNLIVITNAMRWVMSNDVNLNNLYRLMTKLGRINTRIVFLG